MCFFRRKKKDKFKVQSEAAYVHPKTEEMVKTPMVEPAKVTQTYQYTTPTPMSVERDPITKPDPLQEPDFIPNPNPMKEPDPIQNPNPIQEPKPLQEPEPIQEPVIAEKPIVLEQSDRYSGKYEIYPEAGGFKYRLKASNGEILVVSQAYASKNGAASGIETFKKNVEAGVFEFYTDKSDFTQFLLYTANKARLIAQGEFYESIARAQSAAESVKKFYTNEKIINLEAIDPDEMREELVELKPIEPAQNGRFEFEETNGETLFRLKASNGEVLFESSAYSSKSSAFQGLEVVKNAIEAGSFRVMKDKVGRYQFKLYASNKALLLAGETYPNEENCLSALDSVRRFYRDAIIVE